MKIKSGQILSINIISFQFLCVISRSETVFVHAAVNSTLFFSLALVLLEHVILKMLLDSSLDQTPPHPQKWYSKSNQDERWGFCLSWHALSTWILTWKDFLDLQHRLGRARSSSFSTFELWLPKDEDKIMSTVLSVKVPHDSIALTTTPDAPEKHSHGEQKFRPRLRKGHDTNSQVCIEVVVLSGDPAAGKTSALGTSCLHWFSYSGLCAGTGHCLSTRGNEIVALNS